MQELKDIALYQALEYSRSLDESAGRNVILQWQKEQPALAQAALEIFPSVIAAQNQDMAYYFMDLCFDIVCILQHAFGPMPSHRNMDLDWLAKQTTLLDTDLEALFAGQTIDPKIKQQLQQRFLNRTAAEHPQPALAKILHESIADYAAENPQRAVATAITQAMTDIVLRLCCNLYQHTNPKP